MIAVRSAWIALVVAACAPSGNSNGPPLATAVGDNVDWSRAEPVEVALDEFAFQPSRVMFAANRPYLLRLRNTGSGGHNFVAPAFFRSAALREAPPPDGVVEVARGEMKEIALVPTQSGEYPLECTHFLHSMLDMSGQITVR
jgi:plastocyanin